MCEIGHEENRDDLKGFDKVPTETMLKFIDEAIEFHIKYDSGKIPGIVPMSKSNDWVVVPREYVKDEYRNNDLVAGE